MYRLYKIVSSLGEYMIITYLDPWGKHNVDTRSEFPSVPERLGDVPRASWIIAPEPKPEEYS